MADATRVKVERCAKRLRVYIGGEIIAGSIHAKLVWELTHYPTYYFPAADVRMAYLSESDRTERSTLLGQARYFDVRYRNRVVANAPWCYPESPILDIRGYVRFAWDQMEAWFEEEEEVFVHARDPYKRIDLLHSSHQFLNWRTEPAPLVTTFMSCPR